MKSATKIRPCEKSALVIIQVVNCVRKVIAVSDDEDLSDAEKPFRCSFLSCSRPLALHKKLVFSFSKFENVKDIFVKCHAVVDTIWTPAFGLKFLFFFCCKGRNFLSERCNFCRCFQVFSFMFYLYVTWFRYFLALFTTSTYRLDGVFDGCRLLFNLPLIVIDFHLSLLTVSS